MSAILLTNENRGFGGAEVHTLELAQGLARRGRTVHLAARRGSWLEQAGRDSHLRVHALAMRSEIDPLSVMGLRRLIARERIGLVHSHATRDLVLSAAARPRRVPLVKSEHTFLGPHRSGACEWAYRSAAALVSVSRALQAQVQHELGLASEIVYNGIDTERAHPGYPPDPRLAQGRWVGTVGSLIPGKGQEDLLAARLDDVKIAIAGEGPEREKLQAAARSNVEFFGFVQDPLAVLAGLDVVVVPSHQETFSLVSLEAMALGRPLVAAATGGIPEVVEDGVTGTLYPPGDREALAAAVRRYLQDPDLVQRHGKAARQRAVERFSQDVMFQALEALYRRCGWSES